jgi:DNA-directed RNA polymerase omega subunit
MLDHAIPQPMKTSVRDESKFRIILLIAGRAKQIQAGAKPLVHTIARKATRIAREEFRAGLIPYEILPAAAR